LLVSRGKERGNNVKPEPWGCEDKAPITEDEMFFMGGGRRARFSKCKDIKNRKTRHGVYITKISILYSL